MHEIAYAQRVANASNEQYAKAVKALEGESADEVQETLSNVMALVGAKR